MMRTSNPALSSKIFTSDASYSGQSMTIDGTVNKSLFLLACILLTASYSWSNMESPLTSTLMMVGVFGGLIVALITVFKKEWSPYTAPTYALLKGFFLGGISAFLEASFPGIVIQAVALTFGTFFCLLLAYKSGYIKATENFKLGIVAATGAVALIYFVTMILGFFGMNVPYIHDNGIIGIGFSLVVVVIAALNLVLDFDFIEQGAESRAPKYMEWYAAFGLMVTLVWLYIEILRLLAKLNSRK
jgi:uncharacterized YccA/Bax inhibitor family protein